MTVTLELPSDMGAELSERAALSGQAITDYFLALAEAELRGDYELSKAQREEEALMLRERIQDRLSGDKGILLEDYWAEVLAKRETRSLQKAAEQAA